jgi:hypothetical protein
MHTGEAVAAKNRGILDRISVAKTNGDHNESDGVQWCHVASQAHHGDTQRPNTP